MSRPGLLLRMRLRSDPKMLCAVRGAVAPLAESLGLSSQQCRAVVLAIDEALTNVIRHAYLGRADRPLSISFRRSRLKQPGHDDVLEILIADRGLPVREEALHGRSLEELRPGGLGLHFIREIMDKVEFRHDQGINYLRMLKLLPAAQSHHDLEEPSSANSDPSPG